MAVRGISDDVMRLAREELESEKREAVELENKRLRDFFAVEVMKTIFAGPSAEMIARRDERYDETNWAQVVAANAYEMADAMLAERAKLKK